MDTLLATIGILFGAVGVIIGLLMIAPQVRVHQIEIYSRGSWVFRIGAGLSIIGLLTNLLAAENDALGDIGIVTGVAALMGGIITWGHERKQALDSGVQKWDWQASLTLQMVIFGAVILMTALLN